MHGTPTHGDRDAFAVSIPMLFISAIEDVGGRAQADAKSDGLLMSVDNCTSTEVTGPEVATARRVAWTLR